MQPDPERAQLEQANRRLLAKRGDRPAPALTRLQIPTPASSAPRQAEPASRLGDSSLFREMHTEGDVNERWWKRAAKAPTKLQASGFFPEHAKWTLARFADVSEVAWNWSRTPTHGLLIAGPVGTGKTSLAGAIARVFVCSGYSAKFRLSRTLFREIWETYRDGSRESESQIVAELCGVDLLVIDDLDKEGRITDATVSALHEILSTRRGHERPTIITTNLGGDETRRLYGDSLASRILSFTPLVLRGADKRLA